VCDTPNPPATSTGFLDQACSSWIDGDSTRAYIVSGLGVDGFDWAIVEQQSGGWRATSWSICSNQNQVSIDQTIDARQANVAKVRQDDCRFPPSPFDRPTLRLGPRTATALSNGRTEFQVRRALLYPGRGIKIPISIHNISGQTVPWTADIASTIYLRPEDGDPIAASEVGGTLAQDVPAGMPADAYWYGWLLFPTETPGMYTLLYPGQQPLRLDLTPTDCLIVCGSTKPE
jgi:hypothetical protein